MMANQEIITLLNGIVRDESISDENFKAGEYRRQDERRWTEIDKHGIRTEHSEPIDDERCRFLALPVRGGSPSYWGNGANCYYLSAFVAMGKECDLLASLLSEYSIEAFVTNFPGIIIPYQENLLENLEENSAAIKQEFKDGCKIIEDEWQAQINDDGDDVSLPLPSSFCGA